jgi:malonate-semialdehyde dehydrogenase (acetylating) / methylmalonate-semialdehyde dehydrogenase
LVVDGRSFRLQGYENGFYLGPYLFDRVTPDMNIYQAEIFGPVLSILRCGCRTAVNSETAGLAKSKA